jgi:hypothetical protein
MKYLDNPVNCRANTCTDGSIGQPRELHLSFFSSPGGPVWSSGEGPAVEAETTGNTKPGRKRKANPAKTLAKVPGPKAGGVLERGRRLAEEQFCGSCGIPVDPGQKRGSSWG